jgi:hypothetical protein
MMLVVLVFGVLFILYTLHLGTRLHRVETLIGLDEERYKEAILAHNRAKGLVVKSNSK